MKPSLPSLVGLRGEEALTLLGKDSSQVRIIRTLPPRPRVKGNPVAWRVVDYREREEGAELIVTPEWIDWRSPVASEHAGAS